MGILDQVTRMKSEGRSEKDIIRNLQQQGLPPRDIQDALSQAQIKNAVFGESGYGSITDGMQQSIMDQPPAQPTYNQNQEGYSPQSSQEEYVPSPQPPIESYPGQQAYSYPPQQQTQSPPGFNDYQQPQMQNYYPQEQQQYQTDPAATATAENYDYGNNSGGYDPYSAGASSSDSGTLIDIAEQVFAEKTKKMLRQMEELNEFKTLAESGMKSFEERLKRIEAVIDQLQISILDKIGSYGKGLDSIKKEMSMMQDSFGKVVDPFLDRKRRI